MRPRELVLLLVCLISLAPPVRAEEPPVDPWTDPAWESVLFGLERNAVRAVATVEQLFNEGGGSAQPLSTRTTRIEFEATGRPRTVMIAWERRGERAAKRSFSYVYRADGTLARIDEDGSAVAALERTFDAAGRITEEARRTGALIQRTRFLFDKSGRDAGRVIDPGGAGESTESRFYHASGALKRIVQKRGRLFSKTVEFDAGERPVRIRVFDGLDRHETTITYPTPLTALHVTQGVAATRDRIGTYERRAAYRVRDSAELRRRETPERPVGRSEETDGRRHEVHVEFDEKGRVRLEREVDPSGATICRTESHYHAAGPPLWVRTTREHPAAPCTLSSTTFESVVEADERGNWTRQAIETIPPAGPRMRIAVQTRTIEYLP